MGMSKPFRDKCSCKSMSLIFGICTSNTRHPVSAIDDDRRNDSADAKVTAENPSDLTRSLMVSRVKAWSSTIEISGTSAKGSPSSISPPPKPLHPQNHGATKGLIGEIVPEC